MEMDNRQDMLVNYGITGKIQFYNCDPSLSYLVERVRSPIIRADRMVIRRGGRKCVVFVRITFRREEVVGFCGSETPTNLALSSYLIPLCLEHQLF